MTQTYAERVRELEAEGMTTSDAQGVADVEFGFIAGIFDAPTDPDDLTPDQQLERYVQ